MPYQTEVEGRSSLALMVLDSSPQFFVPNQQCFYWWTHYKDSTVDNYLSGLLTTWVRRRIFIHRHNVTCCFGLALAWYTKDVCIYQTCHEAYGVFIFLLNNAKRRFAFWVLITFFESLRRVTKQRVDEIRKNLNTLYSDTMPLRRDWLR